MEEMEFWEFLKNISGDLEFNSKEYFIFIRALADIVGVNSKNLFTVYYMIAKSPVFENDYRLYLYIKTRNAAQVSRIRGGSKYGLGYVIKKKTLDDQLCYPACIEHKHREIIQRVLTGKLWLKKISKGEPVDNKNKRRHKK